MGALFGGGLTKENSAVQVGDGPVRMVGQDRALEIANRRLPSYTASNMPVPTLEPEAPRTTKGDALGSLLQMGSGVQRAAVPAVAPEGGDPNARFIQGGSGEQVAPNLPSSLDGVGGQRLVFVNPSAPQAAMKITTPSYSDAVDQGGTFTNPGLNLKGKLLATLGSAAQGAVLGAGARSFGEGAERAMTVPLQQRRLQLANRLAQQEEIQRANELAQNQELFPIRKEAAQAGIEHDRAETVAANARAKASLRPEIRSLGRGGVASVDSDGRVSIVREPDKPAPNRWSTYLQANGGDAQKAVDAVTADAIRRAQASRSPRKDSAPGELSAGMARAITLDPQVGALKRELAAASKRQSNFLTAVDDDEFDSKVADLQTKLETRVNDILSRSQSPAAHPKAPVQSGKIRVIDKNGVPGTIDAADWEQAQREGYKKAN
jgi:hypothetical protein